MQLAPAPAHAVWGPPVRTINLIWIQGEDHLQTTKPGLFGYLQSWRSNFPDWTVVVWDDDTITQLLTSATGRGLLPADTPQAYARLTRMAMKSDLARYAIIYLLGGMYVDTDMECIRPFAAWLPDDKPSVLYVTEWAPVEVAMSGFVVNNAWFYAPRPGWPVLLSLVESAVPKVLAASPQTLTAASYDFVVKTAGPVAFSKAVLAAGPDNVHMLPNALLDPVVSRMHLHALEGDAARTAFPFAYAIHHCEASWMNVPRPLLGVCMTVYGRMRESSLALAVCLLVCILLLVVAAAVIVYQRRAVCKPVCRAMGCTTCPA